MRDEILAHIGDPRELEKMYRTNRGSFRRTFTTLYPNLKGNALAEFWNERLNYEADEINWGTAREFLFVLVASLIAGVVAKLPDILPLGEEFFYPRNAGFLVFPFLTAYFSWKNRLSAAKIALMAGLTLVGLIFINALPDSKTSDTLILSCVHLVLFLWSILAFGFVGNARNDVDKRLSFLKYIGDLAVMSALIVISGGILSGVTIGLFSLIGFNIENFYFENIVLFALPAVPIVATYLIQTNPQLVGKVTPLIARIFSPLVLVMLIIYLVAMIYAGRDPYNDREFLLIFNALLIGVMAIIFFSVAESSRTDKSRTEIWILFLLCITTIIVNGIALSAILFRISEWGVTPNRIAILGGNALILINLLLVTIQFFKVLSNRGTINDVGKTISVYLPIYFAWSVVVTFLFPFLFGFK